MKVSIKDLSVDMEIKNTGVELDVYDNAGKHLGDLVVTKTGLTWCQGRTTRANGQKISWADFIKFANPPAAKKAPTKKASKPAP
jgi:hypothetical protein